FKEELRHKWDKAISEKKVFSGVYQIKTANAEIKWVWERGRGVYDEEGNIIALEGFIGDITEIKNLQEELKVAKKVADAANSAKSEFLAIVSHELRTPLSLIKGYVYILKKMDFDINVNNYFSKIGKASDSLLSLINNILDFSKLESDHVSIKFRQFNIHDMVERVLSTVTFNLKNSNKPLEIYCDMNVNFIYKSDEAKIEQILLNLLLNALKFTDKGFIKLQIRQNKNHLIFKVEDTGVGIKEKFIKNIFDVFSQIDSSTTRNYGGVGLGLSIVKKNVDLLQGEIDVESSPGKGTTFSLKIPFEETEEHNLELEKFNKKVNLIDFDNNNIEIMEKIFQNYNIQYKLLNLNFFENDNDIKLDNELIFINIPFDPGQIYERVKNFLIKSETENKNIIIMSYFSDMVEKLKKDTENNQLIFLEKPVMSVRINRIIKSLEGIN
ncbi:MAG: PAS domain-containing sensor histidine kinase, partial [Candidatus Muiribacteriota bacterium]